MSEKKSDNELAFLKDLYVSTDWGERFAALMDENIQLPKKGRILYIEAGTGGHAMAMLDRAEEDVHMVCVDESEESLELARTKAVALNAEPEFRRGQLDALWLRDNQFETVIGDGSLVAPERLPKMLSEMARVAMPRGTVALALVTAASFGEFISIYWEALLAAGFDDHGVAAEELLKELPTVAAIEEMAAQDGLEKVTSSTRVEEFSYESAEEFLNSPLITDFLMPMWMRRLPEEATARVLEELARIIDEDRNDADFLLTVKATLITGRKK